MFDVIVIGARCAGSPLAMLLARKGHKVLVVDKARFPSDTLSTHFLWPRGASYLNRWGMLERVTAEAPPMSRMTVTMEDIVLSGQVPREIVRQRFQSVHGDDGSYAVSQYLSPRRKVLDKVLVDAAVEAGAEVREGFRVDELLVTDGRVVGIRGTTAEGAQVMERAKVVVGADGRRSFTAQMLNLPRIDERTRCSFAYWTYFSGFKVDQARLFRRGRLSLSVVPTSFGHNIVLVFGPAAWFKDFMARPEENYFTAMREVSPEMADLVQSGRREEKFYGTADQVAFSRQAAGPGWALAGDSACFKDQCTASGMTHAFRDADLLADALDAGLSGRKPLDESLLDYRQRRYEDTYRYYDFVCSQAEMNPLRVDELHLFDALSRDQEQTERFLAAFGDSLPINTFFSQRSIDHAMRSALHSIRAFPGYEARLDAADLSPFQPPRPVTADDVALSRSMLDFARPVGSSLLRRTEGFHRWVEARAHVGMWPYSRSLHGPPGPEARTRDSSGRPIEGVNFASQDYLALGSHPRVHEAAREALDRFGPHSAGSPMGIANTELSLQVEAALAEMLFMPHVVLFPTGWAAGYAAIAGLVRPDDHVLLDKYAHACLQQGAHAATRKIIRFPHLSVGVVADQLRALRRRDARNGVLVVTEGLFSADSDSPNLRAMQEICREYDATLLVDVAHDFGGTGPRGTGQLGAQGILGEVDLVIGSFSKSFVSNGGFVASHSPAVRQYLKMFGSTHMFSNALSPMQSAIVLTAARIIASGEGDRLRATALTAINAVRDGLTRRGVRCLGNPSPIVPAFVGEEQVLRVAHRLLSERHVSAIPFEWPMVPAAGARFRLQVMASHTVEHAQRLVEALSQSIEEARAYLAERGTSGAPAEPALAASA